MNLEFLTAPVWERLVHALLHTLWEGGLLALLLGQVLRRTRDPFWRYRFAFGSLTLLVLAGLVTWAALQPVAHAGPPVSSPDSQLSAAVLPAASAPAGPPVQVVSFPAPAAASASPAWTAWLAGVWLLGLAIMLIRASLQVAGAERLRRASQPATDPQLQALFDDCRRALNLARRVRLAVTDRLTSPAVAGLLVPTLIVPLTLTTTLSAEQIRLILLHELAHIRRGDYLAGLFQLLAESLLFFNPAVWWISHQIRAEREACCDAAALALGAAPVEYAQTLLHVAENLLQPPPDVAPAFGSPRHGHLLDRVQRLLVPGYRPALRLSWRAMVFAMFTGGALLILAALGTQATLAAILTPQQRIDRIEQKMAQYGQTPLPFDPEAPLPNILISGHIKTADGAPVPQWINLQVQSQLPRSSLGSADTVRDGQFSITNVTAGTIYLAASVSGYAPAVIGPLDGITTNRLENLELILDHGHEVKVLVTDADTGRPVPGGKVSLWFWMANMGVDFRTCDIGPDGFITLVHCADLPFDTTINVPGYEFGKHHFDHAPAGTPLTLPLKAGAMVTGTVRDRATGQPLAGALIQIRYETGIGNLEWNDALSHLARTDDAGTFALNQICPDTTTYLGVSAPGHESTLVTVRHPSATPVDIRLGPEQIVQGHLKGSLDKTLKTRRGHRLDFWRTETYREPNNGGENSTGESMFAKLNPEPGGASFRFTNRLSGDVSVNIDGRSFRRTINGSVDDWIIDLTTNTPAELMAKNVRRRAVTFRFHDAAGASPKGNVRVTIPDDPGHAHIIEPALTNGEVTVTAAVGGNLDVSPGHAIGFWFRQNYPGTTVTAGDGPQIVDIPVIPAGAIYASAKNSDGTPAGGLFYKVDELKRSPLRDRQDYGQLDEGDGFNDNSPRHWVSGPLPLGGTYQVTAWRGNAFCISQPIKLTEAIPDAEAELQFPPGQTFTGIVTDDQGNPLPAAPIDVGFTDGNNHSFGLTSPGRQLTTDAQGRFQIEGMTPGVGTYYAQFNIPHYRAEAIPLEFTHPPMNFRLHPGLLLSGRILDQKTGWPIPDATVRVWHDDTTVMLPQPETHTGPDGRFVFNTLSPGKYNIYVNGANNFTWNTHRRDGDLTAGQTNLDIRVTPYPGGGLKPQAPVESRTPTNKF